MGKSIVTTIALAVGVFLIAPVSADKAGPEEIVRETTEAVLAELRAYEGNLADDPDWVYDLVREKALPHFNFQLITRFALGRHWGDASDEQRERISDELRTLMVRTYSQPLLEYDGEAVEYDRARTDEERGRSQVRVRIEQRDGPSVPLTYQFRYHEEHGWQVYDVVVEGVSLVTSYRDSFSGEIRRRGMDGLIERLAERNRRGETEL